MITVIKPHMSVINVSWIQPTLHHMVIKSKTWHMTQDTWGWIRCWVMIAKIHIHLIPMSATFQLSLDSCNSNTVEILNSHNSVLLPTFCYLTYTDICLIYAYKCSLRSCKFKLQPLAICNGAKSACTYNCIL